MAMKVEKQSSKVITPFVPTPPTLRHYKLGFIDEFVATVDVGIVLFFSANSIHNPNLVTRLEKSLAKTLARFYPLAGRYLEENHTIVCNDQGAEFIHAKANINLEDFLVSGASFKLTDDLIPHKTGVAHHYSDFLLASQVTTFACGGVALGVSGTHKIVDASTLCTFINEWAVLNRDEIETEFTGPGFNSSILFPSRGLSSVRVQPVDDDMLSNYTKKKFIFSESVISNMKAKGDNSIHQWSKVQIVSAIIWKAIMIADLAMHSHLRESVLIQAINLREKMGSLLPKNTCGNLWGFCATECKTLEKTKELVEQLSDSVKKTVSSLSKVHHDSEEGQVMVLNSLSIMTKFIQSSYMVIISSWCKFPFYEADFGFGKPISVAPWIIPGNPTTYLMDNADGNGVEAYVCLQVKDVPYFEEALELVKAFVD